MVWSPRTPWKRSFRRRASTRCCALGRRYAAHLASGSTSSLACRSREFLFTRKASYGGKTVAMFSTFSCPRKGVSHEQTRDTLPHLRRTWDAPSHASDYDAPRPPIRHRKGCRSRRMCPVWRAALRSDRIASPRGKVAAEQAPACRVVVRGARSRFNSPVPTRDRSPAGEAKSPRSRGLISREERESVAQAAARGPVRAGWTAAMKRSWG